LTITLAYKQGFTNTPCLEAGVYKQVFTNTRAYKQVLRSRFLQTCIDNHHPCLETGVYKYTCLEAGINKYP